MTHVGDAAFVRPPMRSEATISRAGAELRRDNLAPLCPQCPLWFFGSACTTRRTLRKLPQIVHPRIRSRC